MLQPNQTYHGSRSHFLYLRPEAEKLKGDVIPAGIQSLPSTEGFGEMVLLLVLSGQEPQACR